MRTLALIIMTVAGINLSAQPFMVGKITRVLYDYDRGKRRIPVEIYYPSASTGVDAPMDTSAATFPVICFGHGFVMNAGSYSNIRQSLVPAGFIVAFPKTETGIAPSHAAMAKDISFVIRYIKDQGKTPDSFFYHKIGTGSCAMGHSMGGGAAVLAAALDKNINSLVLLAPAETRPSAIAAAEGITVPSLVFSGTNDCITVPSKHHLPIFDSLKSSDKLFIAIVGGNHCYMADDNRLCNLGEATCNGESQISRREQQDIVNRYLLPWLGYHLKGANAAWQDAEKFMSSDKEINSIKP